jgi:hypothetical protein
MPRLKLTYFDFHGGRGEPARLALSMGGMKNAEYPIHTADHLQIARALTAMPHPARSPDEAERIDEAMPGTTSASFR